MVYKISKQIWYKHKHIEIIYYWNPKLKDTEWCDLEFRYFPKKQILKENDYFHFSKYISFINVKHITNILNHV